MVARVYTNYMLFFFSRNFIIPFFVLFAQIQFFIVLVTIISLTKLYTVHLLSILDNDLDLAVYIKSNRIFPSMQTYIFYQAQSLEIFGHSISICVL